MTTDAPALRRIEVSHPLRGFGGLVVRELLVWFPWRWLILTATSAGVFALIYIPWSIAEANTLGTLLYVFFGFWLAVMLVSVVSLTEGAVLGEIEGGTASWLVAMPVARPAVIIAKFVGAAMGIAAVVFTVGGAAYPILSSASQRGITAFNGDELTEALSSPIGMWGRFTTLATPGEWTLVLLATAAVLIFVAAVMVLFGAMLHSRVVVFGLGLGVAGVFGGLAAAGAFAAASPAGLIGAVVDTLQAQPATFATPLLATLGWTAVVLMLGVWRFNRRELP